MFARLSVGGSPWFVLVYQILHDTGACLLLSTAANIVLWQYWHDQYGAGSGVLWCVLALTVPAALTAFVVFHTSLEKEATNTAARA